MIKQTQKFFRLLSAAHRVSSAVQGGRKPVSNDVQTLGINGIGRKDLLS